MNDYEEIILMKTEAVTKVDYNVHTTILAL